jgi:hypothetical protein
MVSLFLKIIIFLRIKLKNSSIFSNSPEYFAVFERISCSDKTFEFSPVATTLKLFLPPAFNKLVRCSLPTIFHPRLTLA